MKGPTEGDEPPRPKPQIKAQKRSATIGEITPPTPVHDYHLRDLPDIINGVLHAGGVNVLSGATHSGKSTLIAQLVYAMLTGRPFFGYLVRRPSTIAYLALDHSWELYAMIFDRAGVDPKQLVHYARRDDADKGAVRTLRDKVEKTGAYGALDHLTKKMFGPGGLPADTFLIVDPIHPLTGRDINDHAKVGDSMTEIGQFGRHNKTSIFCTAHSPKIAGDVKNRYVRAIDRGAGSTALAGYAETSCNIGVPEETEDPSLGISQLTIVPRLTSMRVINMKRGEQGLFVPVSGQIVLMPETDSKAEQTAREFYEKNIKVGRVYTTAELRVLGDKVGYSLRTLDRYLQYLKDGKLMENPERGTWQAVKAKKGATAPHAPQ